MVLRGLDLAGQSWNFSRSSSLAYIFLAVPDGPLYSPAYVAVPSCAIDAAAGNGVPPSQKPAVDEGGGSDNPEGPIRSPMRVR